jgi:hypothetical protein
VAGWSKTIRRSAGSVESPSLTHTLLYARGRLGSGWMDCRLVAFLSPGDMTELRPIEPSLARVRVEKSGNFQVQGCRWRARAAAPSKPPVLVAGEATTFLPDQSSWLRTRTLIVAPRCSSAPEAALRSSTKGTGGTSASAICARPPSEAAPLTAEVRAGLVCSVGVILLVWLHR